jgi:PAS domain S-box-containing protein
VADNVKFLPMSFRLKTILGVATIEALLLLFLIWSAMHYLRASNEEELIKRASSTLTLLSQASHDAVLSTDIATLDDIVAQAIKTPELAYVRIMDNRGFVLAEARNAPPSTQPFRADHSYHDVDDGIFDRAADIGVSNSRYGRIELGLSAAHINLIINSARRNITAIALLEMILVALFSLALGSYLTRQLSRLNMASSKIASGEYGYQIRIDGNDELARTAAAFNRMSMELKEDREKQNAILRSALDSIISIDEHGHILEFNQAAEVTFGYRRAEILGKPMKDVIIPPSRRAAHDKGMARYLATGESPIMDKRIQVTAMRADGTEFPAELAVTAVEIDSKKLFTAFMRDISERIRSDSALKTAKEAAESANMAKTRFLANMSHEIRTPLNALLGFLGLLREQANITEEQHTWITTAQQSGASLMHLINETLDFSRIETGRVVLEPHDFDIRELVNSTMTLLAPKAAAKSLEFTAKIADHLPGRIHEDSARLRQVLINLLDNAIKYTDSGSIELTLERTQHKDQPHLYFSITDTGRGIPKSEHDVVFSEFTRLVESGSMISGSGLGLSISRRLVELMGGSIDFESGDNGGTRFWLMIPLHAARNKETPLAPSYCEGSCPRLQKSRILLADDSPANQMLAVAMLQSSGCSIDTVSNGLEALAAVRNLPYDLVLMDIAMPEMDGLEATDAIRALPGDRGKIPVIAMTAHAIVGDREKFMAAGMSDYLPKPVTKEQLYETLCKWLPLRTMDVDTDTKETTVDQTTSQALDTTVFDQLARDTSEEILPLMLEAFCRETRGRIENLGQLDKGDALDADQLQREAHTLKSTAATFGATELNRIARDVEAACRDGRLDEAREMLAALIDSSERAIDAVEEYLAGVGSRDTRAANPS